MDPLLAWFATQVLGPHLVDHAWDCIAEEGFRSRLARDAVAAVPENVPRRRVKRWLARESTWRDLVQPSESAVNRLVSTLVKDLKPRLVIRRERHNKARRRATAESVVGEVAARFIQSLEPSLATAVAHYWS